MKNRNLKHSDEWETPDSLFNELDKEFHFKIDVCASIYNAKCNFFYSKMKNGLTREWHKDIKLFHHYMPDDPEYTEKNPYSLWCNPPYSRMLKESFIKKAYEESFKDARIVMLLPVSTSTKIFHEIIYHNTEIRFLERRVKFKGINTKGKYVDKCCGMHDSMIVIFSGHKRSGGKVNEMYK